MKRPHDLRPLWLLVRSDFQALPKTPSGGSYCRCRSCRSALVAFPKQAFLYPTGNLTSVDLSLPFCVGHRIEAFAFRRLDVADKLCHRLRITRNKDFILYL